MKIDAMQLAEATGAKIENASHVADEIGNTIDKWKITNVPEFIAQMAAESQLFSRLVENLYYTTPQRLIDVWPTRFRLPQIENGEQVDWDAFLDGKRNAMHYIKNPYKLAEFTYGGRMGNKPEGSGDGWLFRGRGLKMITGLDNYLAYQKATGIEVTNHQDLLELPRFAADSSGWFWVSNHLNGVDDVKTITRRVTGDQRDRDFQRRLSMTAMVQTAFA